METKVALNVVPTQRSQKLESMLVSGLIVAGGAVSGFVLYLLFTLAPLEWNWSASSCSTAGGALVAFLGILIDDHTSLWAKRH